MSEFDLILGSCWEDRSDPRRIVRVESEPAPFANDFVDVINVRHQWPWNVGRKSRLRVDTLHRRFRLVIEP